MSVLGTAAVFGAKSVAVLAIIIAVTFTACSNSDQGQSISDVRPDTIATVSTWHYSFDSLEAMVATSDLVVVGEVTAVSQGRLMNPDDPSIPTRYRLVTISIQEVIKGIYANSTVLMEEAGYVPNGASFEIDEMPWSNIGDVGIFFLAKYPDQPEGHYSQISPEGRLLTAIRDSDGAAQLGLQSVLNFSDSALGESLGLIESSEVHGKVRAASEEVVKENISADKPLWELLAEIRQEEEAGMVAEDGNQNSDSTNQELLGDPMEDSRSGQVAE